MVNIFLKQVVAWTGNFKETGDIENKLDKTTEPGGALIYLKVFTKITVSDRRKTYSSGVRMICELVQIFLLFCKGEFIRIKCGSKNLFSSTTCPLAITYKDHSFYTQKMEANSFRRL